MVRRAGRRAAPRPRHRRRTNSASATSNIVRTRCNVQATAARGRHVRRQAQPLRRSARRRATALDSARRVELIERAKREEHADVRRAHRADARIAYTARVAREATQPATRRRSRPWTAAARRSTRSCTTRASAAQAVAARRRTHVAAARRTSRREEARSSVLGRELAAVAVTVPGRRAGAGTGGRSWWSHRHRPAGVHPMHDHPFLVCTRNRESRGQLRRRQFVRPLLRRVPVPPRHVGRHGDPRRPARPWSACCRTRRRSTTRTTSPGRSTSGRATHPGAAAADAPFPHRTRP